MSEAQELVGGWYHERSGLVLPRGAVVTYSADESHLALLDAQARARGAAASERLARKVRRSEHDSAVLQELCAWLQSQRLDCMGVVSFSDAYAARHGIYSPKRALDDVWRGITQDARIRGSHGFRGRFVLAAEWHRTGREVPHVHAAFEGVGNRQSLCYDFWRHFKNTRGRCRFEEMRDVDTATLYGLKDVLKEDASTADGFRFRLTARRS